MTVLEKKGPTGIRLPKVGRALIAAALAAAVTVGVAMAINPKVEPATQVEQDQSVAPFLADTDTPTHTGRSGSTADSAEPDDPFLSGTDNPTHTGRKSP